MNDDMDLITYNFYTDIMNVVKGFKKTIPLGVASNILKRISVEMQNQYLEQVNQKIIKLTQEQNNFGNKF